MRRIASRRSEPISCTLRRMLKACLFALPAGVQHNQGHDSRSRQQRSSRRGLKISAKEAIMDTTTLLIIIIVLLVLGGGGWYGRGRWF